MWSVFQIHTLLCKCYSPSFCKKAEVIFSFHSARKSMKRFKNRKPGWVHTRFYWVIKSSIIVEVMQLIGYIPENWYSCSGGSIFPSFSPILMTFLTYLYVVWKIINKMKKNLLSIVVFLIYFPQVNWVPECIFVSHLPL